MQWFIYAPTFFFKAGDGQPSYHAVEAAGAIALLGMKLLRGHWKDSAKACGVAILSIGRIAAAAENARPYHVADILLNAEKLARAAEALGYSDLANDLRSKIAEPNIGTVSPEDFQNAFQARTRQLEEAMNDLGNRYRLLEKPEYFLWDLLQEGRTRANKERRSSEGDE